MDDGSLTSFVVLIGLILLHGLVELIYAALTNVRYTPLKEQSDKGDSKAKQILKLAEDIARLSITRAVVLLLLRFAIVAIATVRIADPLLHAEDAAGVWLIPELGYVAVLLPTALLTYIFGDLIPAALGQAYSDQLAPRLCSPFRAVMIVFSPLTALFLSMSRTLSRVAGNEDMTKAVTEEEIITLIEEGQQGGAIEDEERDDYSVLQFGETLAREVMTPRPDVTAVEIGMPLNEATRTILQSGHSRIPAYERDIDNIKGLLYAKDVLKLFLEGGSMQKPMRDLLRPAYFVPETKRADNLFEEMQERKIHLAVVVDEYGGTAGLVTIEDLLEEIVGDIRDEYDQNEEIEFMQIGEGEYVVEGGMNLEDLNQKLDSKLPNDEINSIGGYIYSKLGHVPEVGESVEEDGLFMRIDAVENRRIRKVYIAKRTQPEPEADKEAKPTDEGESADVPAIDTTIQPKPAS